MNEKLMSEFNDKNCLVTGGSGFIGSNLSQYLSKTGANVKAIDNFSTGRKENSADFDSLGIELIEADISNQEETQSYFEDIDYVFHQAAVPSVPRSIAEPMLTNNSNVKGTLCVLENSRLCNISKVIYAASSSAYGATGVLPNRETINPSPLSPYAAQKLAGEMYCNAYFRCFGLRTTCLRYFNVYGPHQDPNSEYSAVIPIFIKKALSNSDIVIFGDGQTSRDFTYVNDIIQANLRAALSEPADGHVVNVAYGAKSTLNELANLIIEYTDSDSSVKYEGARKGDVRHSFADLSLAKELLDYEPQFDLRRGLKKTIEFFR